MQNCVEEKCKIFNTTLHYSKYQNKALSNTIDLLLKKWKLIITDRCEGDVTQSSRPHFAFGMSQYVRLRKSVRNCNNSKKMLTSCSSSVGCYYEGYEMPGWCRRKSVDVTELEMRWWYRNAKSLLTWWPSDFRKQTVLLFTSRLRINELSYRQNNKGTHTKKVITMRVTPPTYFESIPTKS